MKDFKAHFNHCIVRLIPSTETGWGMDIIAVFFKHIRHSLFKAVPRYNDLPMRQSNSAYFWKSPFGFMICWQELSVLQNRAQTWFWHKKMNLWLYKHVRFYTGGRMLLFINCTAPHKLMLNQNATQYACDHGFGIFSLVKRKPAMFHFLTKWLFRNGWRLCKLFLQANYKINVPATWD